MTRGRRVGSKTSLAAKLPQAAREEPIARFVFQAVAHNPDQPIDAALLDAADRFHKSKRTIENICQRWSIRQGLQLSAQEWSATDIARAFSKLAILKRELTEEQLRDLAKCGPMAVDDGWLTHPQAPVRLLHSPRKKSPKQ